VQHFWLICVTKLSHYGEFALEILSIVYIRKTLFPTTERSKYLSIIKNKLLRLFWQIIGAYCEGHTIHINGLCGQSKESRNVAAADTPTSTGL
jgi:hypothetical protein